MPRPRITEPEIPHFEDAVLSLQGYPSLEKVPRILWKRLGELIERDKKPIHEACDTIAHMVNSSREQVRAKLSLCCPEASLESPSRPRFEPWPSIKNAQKDRIR